MKVSTFFKILNRKIENYEKMTTNPFSIPQPIILIWVEDVETDKSTENKE